MASVISDPNGRKRLQFFGADGMRRTIRLGKATMRQAEAIKFRVEQLALAATGATGVVDDDTIHWLAGLDDGTYGRLAAVGLVQPRTSSTLGAFLDAYVTSRDDIKPGSKLVYGHTVRTLVEFFGADKPMRAITEGDAEQWRKSLTEQGLAEATVCKRTQNAKVFFGVAVKKKLISSNPFSELDSGSKANASRQRFISRQDAQKVLDACPDAEWRLIFSLARYGGLRTPSEILLLKWTDVDWGRGRIHVTSPKTEHHEGKGSRDIPIFPELVKPLHEVFDQASEGADFVITKYRRANCNLRTQLQRILGRAGLKPWPRLFQNLRATRETELAGEYPLHVVTYWIGNTARVAVKHYLQIPDSIYEQAAQNQAHEVQKEAQQTTAMLCNRPHDNPPEGHKTADLAVVGAETAIAQSDSLEAGGFEPPSRDVSRSASTCVVARLRVRLAKRRTTGSPLSYSGASRHRRPGRPTRASPLIDALVRPAGAVRQDGQRYLRRHGILVVAI
jgi:integrase